MKLGQILVRKRTISPQVLQQTIYLQVQATLPLGELLKMEGLIAEDDLTRALQEQKWRRQGYWVID